MTERPETPTSTSSEHKLGLKAILQSVFAAALGVQSSHNRERDFKQGSAKVYIISGVVFTALFIGAVVTVVQLVLAGR